MVLWWCICKHCSQKCLFSTPPRQNTYVAVFWPITDIGCCVGHKKGFQTKTNFSKNSPLRLSYGSYTLRPSPECHVPMVLICYNEPTNGTCLVVRPVSEPSIGRRHVGCVFVMFVVVLASAGTPFFLKFSFRWDQSILHDSAGDSRRHQYSWLAHLPPGDVPSSDRWFDAPCTGFCTWGELAQPNRSTRRRIFCARQSH